MAQRGASLEDEVAKAAKTYLSMRIARLYKVDPPYRQVSGADKGGVFRAIRLKAGHVDFYGVMLSGPRRHEAVAVECKMTSKDTFPRSNVPKQQQEWLDDTPVSIVLVHFTRHGVIRAYNWHQWPARTSAKPDTGWPCNIGRFLHAVPGIVE
jgi:penicillin-binding protein-related factor A (putative recombinase)